MTGLRSQRSMKRGSAPTPVCSELRLFSRKAIALIEGDLSVMGIFQQLLEAVQITLRQSKRNEFALEKLLLVIA
jgi:hypothetical protein